MNSLVYLGEIYHRGGKKRGRENQFFGEGIQQLKLVSPNSFEKAAIMTPNKPFNHPLFILYHVASILR